MIVFVKVPSIGESINEVTISKWVKKSGSIVKADELICEIESEKATFEINAEQGGQLSIKIEEGKIAKIGEIICEIDTESKGWVEKMNESLKEKDETQNKDSFISSPASRKLMAENDLLSNEIKGSGKEGRIRLEDVQETLTKTIPTNVKQQVKNTHTSVVFSREEKKEKMSSLRKTISKRLVQVKNETAMLTTFNEVDMKPIQEIRTRHKEMFKEKYEIGLGYMSFFIKAVCIALKEWPSVNASIQTDEIIYYPYCDISVAVSTPKGLVVPVIRNAESLNMFQLENELLSLAEKARNGKITIEEMTGGTFTISNGGVFGSLMSTPIINAPQSAILGMHNIVERPVAMDGQIIIRPMMYLALSYDHRLIDGRESVGFLVRVKQLIEDPVRMLLEV